MRWEDTADRVESPILAGPGNGLAYSEILSPTYPVAALAAFHLDDVLATSVFATAAQAGLWPEIGGRLRRDDGTLLVVAKIKERTPPLRAVALSSFASSRDAARKSFFESLHCPSSGLRIGSRLQFSNN
jgi:hypothetical protein